MEKNVQEMMEVNVIHGKDEGIIEMKRLNVTRRLAGLLLFCAVFFMTAITGFAAEGKVVAKTANIRAQASSDSEVVAGTTQGKTIDIQGAVKDASGTIWYQVPISGGGHGYIRSDLVQTNETIKVSESAPASSGSSSSGSPAETVPTAIGETQAVIKSEKNVRVRSGASTQHSAVGSLPNGTGITLIGEANDNAGKKWYQITCNYNGKTVEGYVRSDLVEVGAAGSAEGGETPPEGEGEGGENPEGEAPEGEGGENPGGETGEPEPAPEPEHNDYEVVYAQNDTGEYEYYLYNNVEGNRQKLNELLSAVGVANENNQKLQKQVDNSKIIIIVLAVVIVLLFIAVTVLIFKVRSLSYDYEYEEDEEEETEEEEADEEEEEEAPVRKRRRKTQEEDEGQEEAPVRRRRTSSEVQERTAKSGDRQARSRAKGERELYAAEDAQPARKQASRKPQNFLIDDDEFEFEFLNMDDKDL